MNEHIKNDSSFIRPGDETMLFVTIPRLRAYTKEPGCALTKKSCVVT